MKECFGCMHCRVNPVSLSREDELSLCKKHLEEYRKGKGFS